MNARRILVAATAGDNVPVGEFWRLTAKKSDYYFDLADGQEAFHLSIHGPKKGRFTGHRFHLKINTEYARTAHLKGQFMASDIGVAPLLFNGTQMTSDVFRVMRVRWMWDMFRPRYRQAAHAGAIPTLPPNGSGIAMTESVMEGHVIDLDVYLSYGQPYWPSVGSGFRDTTKLIGKNGDGRYGPIPADGGMLLTASFLQHWPGAHPSPAAMVPPRPSLTEVPNRVTCIGVGPDKPDDMCWIVQSITSRQIIEDSLEATLNN